jgi:hypothetical protein
VPARSGEADDAPELLQWAIAHDGPAVAVLRAKLVAASPTA